MAVLPRVSSRTLGEFVLTVLEDLRGKEAEDNITPAHPLMTMLKSHDGIEERNRGEGPTEDVLYKTPSRGVLTSLSAPYAEKDETPTTGHTRAKYDWIQALETLVLSNVEITNNQGPTKLFDLVKRKRRITIQAMKNNLYGYVWAGLTSSSEKVFGLNDLIQFAPGTAPSRGNPGGLDPAAADQTWWRNQFVDYDTAYRTVNTGEQTKTMVEDPGSTKTLTDLWFACTDNPDGQSPDGKPNLMPANAVFYKQYSDLITRKLVFAVTGDRYDLSVDDGMWYKSGVIFYDASVPAAPTAGEGVCIFLNTRTIKWCYAKGLREDWGTMYNLSRAITGKGWDLTTQFGMTCNNRGKNGVFFGSKAISVS